MKQAIDEIIHRQEVDAEKAPSETVIQKLERPMGFNRKRPTQQATSLFTGRVDEPINQK